MRLIDADYLLSTFQCVCSAVSCEECRAKYKNGTCKLEHWLKAQPTIEERKKGKWIVPQHDLVISGTCSCCGWDAILFETDVAGMPYCPNCGAEMREEKTDECRL